MFAEPKFSEAKLIELMLEHGAPMVEHVLTKMGLGEFSAGAVRDAVGHLTAQYQAGAVDKKLFLDGTYGPAVQALAASVLADKHGVSQSHKALEVTGSATPQQDAQPYESAMGSMKLLKLDRVDEAIEAWKRAAYNAEKGRAGPRAAHGPPHRADGPAPPHQHGRVLRGAGRVTPTEQGKEGEERKKGRDRKR